MTKVVDLERQDGSIRATAPIGGCEVCRDKTATEHKGEMGCPRCGHQLGGLEVVDAGGHAAPQPVASAGTVMVYNCLMQYTAWLDSEGILPASAGLAALVRFWAMVEAS